MSIKRQFIIGEDWLYYKIYTGVSTTDRILTNIIQPIAQKLIEDKIIDQWFYIRYADPDHHLRVRFHFPNSKINLNEVVRILTPYLNDLLNKNLVWKVQTDTYQREIERYGDTTIELSESLFYYDSELNIQLIKGIEDTNLEDKRWLISMAIIDSYLDSFKYSFAQKMKLLERLMIGYGKEFGMNSDLRKQLSDKYRSNRKLIDGFLMTNKNDLGSEYYFIFRLIENHSKRIISISNEIEELSKNDNLKIQYDSLLSSFIHMTMNRLFKSKNRIYEMVCYDFLHRYYISYNARFVKNKKSA